MGTTEFTPVTGFSHPAGATAHLIEPDATIVAIATTPTSKIFILNCRAMAIPIKNGINDVNNVKIALKSAPNAVVPNPEYLIIYFITADGKTPIKIPCAEPDKTLKKKSFKCKSV